MTRISKNDRHAKGRTVLLTAIVASAMVPAVAAAQDAPTAPTGSRIPQAAVVPDEQEILIIGAITDPKAAKPVDNPLDEKLPALPVVYDDDTAPAAPTAS